MIERSVDSIETHFQENRCPIPIIILCVLMPRFERRSGSHEREGVDGWRNAIGSGRQRWPREEPPDDGRQEKSSGIRYRRYRTQLGERL